MPHTLPELPYGFDALEPYIDPKTMEIHHGKHHAAYVAKLNDALKDQGEWQDKPIEELLQSLDQLPDSIRTKVRNNGGGHYNHSMFWRLMRPVRQDFDGELSRTTQGGQEARGEPTGELADAIKTTFGSFEEFKKQFSDAAANHFGSGWAWLALDENKKLHIHSLPNQDSPIMHGHKPVLGLDIWEHAYYLKYQNKRPEYIENWWSVVSWDRVEENFLKVK